MGEIKEREEEKKRRIKSKGEGGKKRRTRRMIWPSEETGRRTNFHSPHPFLFEPPS